MKEKTKNNSNGNTKRETPKDTIASDAKTNSDMKLFL